MDDITIQMYSFYGVDNDEELRVARRIFHSDRDVTSTSCIEDEDVEVKDIEIEDDEI